MLKKGTSLLSNLFRQSFNPSTMAKFGMVPLQMNFSKKNTTGKKSEKNRRTKIKNKVYLREIDKL